jgi:serine/threonine-protein kinase
MLGKYGILEEIGHGGFATVYRALDMTLDREVALKVLHPQLLTDAGFVERFQREACALARLRHPQIVTIYEVGEAEQRLYIAMELARGSNLAQAIAERGHIPWAEVLALLEPICAALDYAHGKGMVHRDLKPSNILLDEERGPLLTDFGFARLLGASSVSLSLSGGILGTPAYIAPEVWELNAAQPAVDIYALGCIAYEMLTGEALFRGETPMQVMRAHDKGPRFPKTWPEGVPAGIEEVLGKALQRDPGSRYPSAAALHYALQDLERKAQAEREAAERAEVAAQWRAETEAAMARAWRWAAGWPWNRMTLGHNKPRLRSRDSWHQSR